MEEILTEIVSKECERYRLIEFELLSSIEEGVELLKPMMSQNSFNPKKNDFRTFSLWRKEVLINFYERLGYRDFLRKNKKGTSFLRLILYIQKRLLKRMHKDCKEPTIDKDLAVSGHTVAFKVSKGLLGDTVSLWNSMLDDASFPEDIEKVCRDFCVSYFPLDWNKFLRRLEKKDSDFWKELFLFIKMLVVYVTNKYITTVFYVSSG